MTEQPIPEHHYRCTKCGRLVDMRELMQVFAHEEDPCPDDAEIARRAAAFGPTTARRVGDPTEWRGGKPTNLN